MAHPSSTTTAVAASPTQPTPEAQGVSDADSQNVPHGAKPEVLRRIADLEAHNSGLLQLEDSRLGELRQARSHALGHLLRHGGDHMPLAPSTASLPTLSQPASGSSMPQGSSSALVTVQADQEVADRRLAAAEQALRERGKKLRAE